MTEFRPALSLRGANRRGNPYPKRRNFPSISEKTDCMKENVLCVFGNDEKIVAAKDAFGSIKPAL